jgi:protein subunit release factor B
VSRHLVLSVTIADCVVQTFRAGGKGGQHQNKTDSAVRIIHPPSGARGESREHRSQLHNKRAAWGRMARSAAFVAWRTRVLAAAPTVPRSDLKIEVRRNGQWMDSDL